MPKTATVIGAGIAGPMAALVLDSQGFDVTCYESRQPDECDSSHMMSLMDSTEAILSRYGVNHRELYRYDSQPHVMDPDYGYVGEIPASVMWNDLHDALVRRCSVQWGHKVTETPQTDVVVWADGIGSLGRAKYTDRKRGQYAGEMLFRGLGPRDASDMDWYQGTDDQNFEIVSYPTWDRAGKLQRGWTVFYRSERELTTHTVTLTDDQRVSFWRTMRPSAPSTTLDYIVNARDVTVAPQLIWSPVKHMVINADGQYECIIGDANGSVSPRTTMGANLAIMEAEQLFTRGLPEPMIVDEINDTLRTSREMISGLVSGLHG